MKTWVVSNGTPSINSTQYNQLYNKIQTQVGNQPTANWKDNYLGNVSQAVANNQNQETFLNMLQKSF